MQALSRNVLIEKAKALFADGTVTRALGWKAGEFDYDLTPAVFESIEEMEDGFVYSDFSAPNFSKYLVKETIKEGKKTKTCRSCT